MNENLLNFIKEKLIQIQDEGDCHSNSIATEMLDAIQRQEIINKIPSNEELELIQTDFTKEWREDKKWK